MLMGAVNLDMMNYVNAVNVLLAIITTLMEIAHHVSYFYHGVLQQCMNEVYRQGYIMY